MEKIIFRIDYKYWKMAFRGSHSCVLIEPYSLANIQWSDPVAAVFMVLLLRMALFVAPGSFWTYSESKSSNYLTTYSWKQLTSEKRKIWRFWQKCQLPESQGTPVFYFNEGKAGLDCDLVWYSSQEPIQQTLADL